MEETNFTKEVVAAVGMVMKDDGTFKLEDVVDLIDDKQFFPQSRKELRKMICKERANSVVHSINCYSLRNKDGEFVNLNIANENDYNVALASVNSDIRARITKIRQLIEEHNKRFPGQIIFDEDGLHIPEAVNM